MKPILQWACRELNDGWVMIGVDLDLSTAEQPEYMVGLRRAVHPFHFDEMESPVMGLKAVISEMDKTIRRMLVVDAPDRSASRACAFEISDEAKADIAGYVRDAMPKLAYASQRMHKRGGAL